MNLWIIVISMLLSHVRISWSYAFAPSGACNETCGQDSFTSNTGAFQSPCYPNNYGANLNCWYNISVAGASHITIAWDDVYLEDHGCGSDEIQLYASNGTRLKTICNNNANIKINISDTVTEDDSVYIRFVTDNSSVKKGFSAMYAATFPNTTQPTNTAKHRKTGADSLKCPALLIPYGVNVPETPVGKYATVHCDSRFELELDNRANTEHMFCTRYTSQDGKIDVAFWATAPPKCVQKPNVPPNSCQDVKKIGRHLIDPDGPGGNPPFVVNCVQQDQSFVTTVEHLNGGNIFLSSPGNFTRTVRFVYNASVSQLEGLTKAAASCRQFTKVECFNTKTFTGFGWWQSLQGQGMTNWGGAPTNTAKCACGETNSCEKKITECNCQRNERVISVDEGYLTDKRFLPVSAVTLNDLDGGAGQKETANLTIGRLECKTLPSNPLKTNCSCPKGFRMVNANTCQCEDIDECTFSNGGCGHTCNNTLGGYECLCHHGFELADDDYTCKDIDECTPSGRFCDQICKNTVGSYWCSCRSGYTQHGDRCNDIDECSVNNGECSNNCSNTDGSYHCECPDGHELDTDHKTCVDIDECAKGIHGCSYKCKNAIGSYVCECPEGYHLRSDRRGCLDTNECSVKNGGCSQRCSNNYGSYSCSCHSGYYLMNDNHTCEDVDECKSNNGGCTQVCNNFPGSYNCSCYAGYELDWNRRSCTELYNVLDTTANCTCQLRLASTTSIPGQELFHVTTLIYGHTKLWATENEDQDMFLVKERFPNFDASLLVNRSPTDKKCLNVLRHCPRDCERFTRLALEAEGLDTSFNHTFRRGYASGKLGDILCEQFHHVVKEPGKAMVAYYNPFGCGHGSSTYHLPYGVCCSKLVTPFGAIFYWDKAAKCHERQGLFG